MKNFIKVSETQSGKEEIAYFQSMIVDAKSGIKIEINCPKCNGEGGLVCFAHVQDGVCFMCKGSKKTFSYNHPNQRNKNKQFKERIDELKSSYFITAELIEDFCNIKEHQTPFFYKISDSWFQEKMKEQGFPYGQIITDYNHLINCNKNFMYE
jgi:hypothetical protein